MIRANLNNTIIFEERIVNLIKNIVCGHYRVSIEKLNQKTKKSEIIRCKHMVVYFSFQILDVPLVRIAELTGYGSDHSMILYIKNKIAGYLSWDKILKKDYNIINNELELALYDFSKEEIDHIEYINLNNVIAIRERHNRAVLAVGLTEQEISEIQKILKKSDLVKYDNTGIYLFNNKKEP
jgi:hypothetical protein